MSKTKHFKRKYDVSEEFYDDNQPKKSKVQDDHRKDKKYRNAIRSQNVYELSRLEDDDYDDVYR